MPNYLVNLSSGQMKGLHDLSLSTGRPMAHFVRQGIDMVLDSVTSCGIVMSGVITSGSVIVMVGR